MTEGGVIFPQPVIVCAANRHRETGEIVIGPRHYSPLMQAQMQAAGGLSYWNNSECGFIDQYEKFYSRTEAWEIARRCGMIRRPTGWEPTMKLSPSPQPDTGALFSENLY